MDVASCHVLSSQPKRACCFMNVRRFSKYAKVLLGFYIRFHCSIRESPPQFENLIMALVYVRSITRSTMYQKSSILLAGTGEWKISFVTCGFSSIKIDYSDCPKSLISRINKVYVFTIKIAIFY